VTKDKDKKAGRTTSLYSGINEPTTGQRCSSKTEKKNIFEDLFSSVLTQFIKYQPSGNFKFNNLGILQSLKLRTSMGKIHQISLELHSKYF